MLYDAIQMFLIGSISAYCSITAGFNFMVFLDNQKEKNNL